MQLHPPALQGGHQRLNQLPLARGAVPEQKNHSRAHYQQHKGVEAIGVAAAFKIQTKKQRHPDKQHKHFVQIAQRHMPRLWREQIAFVPAHTAADQRHAHRCPGQPCAHALGDVALPRCRTARLPRCRLGGGHARTHPEPVAQGGHQHQHPHPKQSRLAGEQIFQPERLARPLHIALIQRHRCGHAQRRRRHEPRQRAPEPAQRNARGHGGQQQGLLVAVHGGVQAPPNQPARQQYQRGKQAIERATVPPRLALRLHRNGLQHLPGRSGAIGRCARTQRAHGVYGCVFNG